jgi:SAM-dependent methyltransferase
MELKLNVGCGKDIREGWINLDYHGDTGANVIFDLFEIFEGNPLPFPDNTFDNILLQGVIHLFMNPIPILDEMVRVCKPGGKIEVKVNMPNSFTLHTQRGYTKGVLMAYATIFKDYKNGESKGSLLKVTKCKYYARYNFLKPWVWLMNLIPRQLVERTFLMYLFNMNVMIIYQKIGGDNDTQTSN